MSSLTDAEMRHVPPGMILRAMVDQSEHEDIENGIKAFIRQFMADYTDETMLPVGVYEVFQRWFQDYMDEDLDDLIQETLDEIAALERGTRRKSERRVFHRYVEPYDEDDDEEVPTQG